MKPDCDCEYCKHKVNERFCPQCGLNFNACESYFEMKKPIVGGIPMPGCPLCPHCHPKDWNPTKWHKNLNVVEKDLCEDFLKCCICMSK